MPLFFAAEAYRMWFSNLQLYRLTKPFTHTAEALAQMLEQHAFKPCGSLDLMTYGWVSPLGRDGSELVHAAGGRIMICARKEQKIVPASVIRERVQEKAEAIEAAQARPVRRKERESIKDEVILDLLPKAFPRSALTFAYISPKENLIVVNAGSAKKAEELLSYLRGSIGSLAAVSPSLNVAPSAIMTQWLNGDDVPHDVTLGDECELRDTVEDGGIIRCKRQDLTTEEIQVHLDAGKRAVKLAINWQEQISCVVNDDLSIKRLRFGEELLEQHDDAPDDDPIAAFDNDFSIMTLELSKFIPRLLEVFGGENEAAYS
jgi:recombination associated protein RdgC